MTEFESLLTNALSPDKQLRQSAENLIETNIKIHPTESFLSLLSFLDSNNENLATLSSVLIYNRYFIMKAFLHVDRSISQKTFDLLVEKLSKPISLKTKKKIGDILAKLSILENSQTDFLGFIVNCCLNTCLTVQNFGLFLFQAACENENLVSLTLQKLDFLVDLLNDKFQKQDRGLIENSIILLYKILTHADQADLEKLGFLFSRSLDFLTQAPNLTLLESLFAATEVNKRIWSGKEQGLMALVLSIVNRNDLSSEVKVSAVDILRHYLDGMVQVIDRKFCEESVTIGFTLLAETNSKQDLEVWAKDDCEEGGIFNSGFALLEDLVCNSLCEVLVDQMVSAHLASNHWIYQNAGISASSLLVSPNFQVLFSFVSVHPRLDWSLLDTLEKLIEKEDHENIRFQTIVLALKISENSYESEAVKLKLVLKSLSVIASIFNIFHLRKTRISQEILEKSPDVYMFIYKYLGVNDTLYDALFSLNKLILATGCFFSNTSNQLISGLVIILNNPICTVRDQFIRKSCIECLGSVVQNLPEVIDFVGLFHMIWKIKETMNKNDEGINAVWEVVPQFQQRLQERFSVYLETIIKELVICLNDSIDIHLCENETPLEDYQTLNLRIEGRGEFIVTMNTAKLKIKEEASSTLYQLIKRCPNSLSPYFNVILESVCSLVRFQFRFDIKRIALKIIKYLPNINSSDSVLVTVFPILAQELAKEKDKNKLLVYLESIQAFLEGFSNVSVIGLTNASYFCGILSNLMSGYITGNEEDVKEYAMRFISEIICLLLKGFKEKFSPVFLQNFQVIFSQLLFSNLNPEILASSLCIYCDFVGYTGNLLIANDTCPLLNQFIKLCYHESAVVRQNAASAISKCIDKDPETVHKYLEEIIPALVFILQLPGSRDDLISGSESAASCIGKISFLFKPELISLFLDWIPFKCDQEEATEVHQMLLNNLNLVPNSKDLLARLKNSEYLTGSCKNYIESLTN